MIQAQTALWLACLLPLIGAVLVGLTGRWPNLRETVTMVTAVATFVVVASLVPVVVLGHRPSVELVQWLPGFGRLGQSR